VLARLGRSFDLFGLDYQVDEDVRDGRPRWGSWAAILSFWVLAVLAAFGQRRASRFGRLVLWAPVAAVLVTAVVFYGGHRLRTAMEPSVVLGAALAVAAPAAARARPPEEEATIAYPPAVATPPPR